MKRLYLDVENCPFCGSSRTGFYIREQHIRPNLIKKFAKHGVIISFNALDSQPLCFCLNCETDWESKPRWKLLNSAQYHERIYEKGVSEVRTNLEKYLKDIPVQKKKPIFRKFTEIIKLIIGFR